MAKARSRTPRRSGAVRTTLFKTQAISTEEHETAVLAVANEKAAVIGAQVALDNAKIAMEDTDVLAPITGTVISKLVERGQVISSPSTDVGGGTVLLSMADLNLVQVSTLVDETDIGKIKPGQRATVTVGSYPNQPFEGEVLKIEPLAADGAERHDVRGRRSGSRTGTACSSPGMNADVEVHIGQRDSVLAVPNAALRTAKDVGSAAQVLGIPDDAADPAARGGGQDSATRCASSAPASEARRRQRQGRHDHHGQEAGRKHHDDARWTRGDAARGRHRGAGARAHAEAVRRRAALGRRERHLPEGDGGVPRGGGGGGGAAAGAAGAAPTSSSAETTSSSSSGTASRCRSISAPVSPISTTAKWSGASPPRDSVLILPSASLVQQQTEQKSGSAT